MKRHLTWIPALFIAFVFIQSLFFKFTGSEETVIIFTTIGAWMSSIGLPDVIAGNFALHGGIAVGSVELVASVLVLMPKTRLYGAVVALFVISGAIFFHLFTPLGVNRIVDAAGNTDGGVLFAMACGVWVCAAGLIIYERISHLKNPSRDAKFG